MQTLLSRRGYYAGGLDGRFNGALADAIKRLCNEESLAECRKGPLSSQAIPAVARVM